MKTKVWVACIAVLALFGGVYGGIEILGSRAGSSTSTAVTACGKHGIDRCPFCTPAVIESMGFCREHGVPEAICTRCRDDLEAAFRAEGDWCGGHGLPESQCEACNPGVLAKYSAGLEAPGGRPPADVEVVRIDDVPRIERAPSSVCATERSVVRFARPEVAERAGLGFADVLRAPLRQTLDAPAELRYDRRRHARLATRAPGTVVEVKTELGERVEAGDVLLVVSSRAFGAAKSELLSAAARVQLWEKNHERERGLLQKSLTTERVVLEAETELTESRIALAAAEQGLHNLGLDDAGVSAVREQQDGTALLPVVAPFDGVVVALDAVAGQLADPSVPLVAVADTARIWAIADVDQAEVQAVAVGQPVLLTVDGSPGETFGGRVTWISTEVDPRTRTVEVRAELQNDGGRLRANTFGRARIVTRDGGEAVLVPTAAVQWEGCCNVAFVRRSDTEFVPRKLLLGYRRDAYIEVLAGLSGGEQVVTEGSFLLKTELQKSGIGAGCCEVDHLGK